MASTTPNINEKPLEIVLDKGAELPDNLPELEQKIFQYFQNDQFNLILDMKHVRLAPTKFIILLIKATSQARRLGGDIKLINLNPMVRNGFVTFTPNTYLSFEPSEKYALYDFGETLDIDDELYTNEPGMNNNKAKKKEPPKQVKDNPHTKDILPVLQSLKLDDAEKVRVSSSADNLYQVCDFVLERAKKAGFDEHELARIKVTVYEASLNVVEHSYFSNPDYWIDVYARQKNGKFYIIIHDWGRSFEFDPDCEYNVEQAVKDRRTGGFGLHIIKRTVDEIYYLSDKQVGNRLILIKNLKKD